MTDRERYVLVRVADGYFLADDFTTWTPDRDRAHEFRDGAALYARWEDFGGARGDVVSRFADGYCTP